MVVIDIDGTHETTELNNVISLYPSITQVTVDTHCENMWANKPGADLGCHPIADYVTAENFPAKQLIIAHQLVISNILSLCIKTH